MSIHVNKAAASSFIIAFQQPARCDAIPSSTLALFNLRAPSSLWLLGGEPGVGGDVEQSEIGAPDNGMADPDRRA